MHPAPVPSSRVRVKHEGETCRSRVRFLEFTGRVNHGRREGFTRFGHVAFEDEPIRLSKLDSPQEVGADPSLPRGIGSSGRRALD